ncbi:hypothetical protein PtB15_1B59 [Puccinia triticina]|nr:hypothetical protein PtB15_1B59 [Puccinia triticina]
MQMCGKSDVIQGSSLLQLDHFPSKFRARHFKMDGLLSSSQEEPNRTTTQTEPSQPDPTNEAQSESRLHPLASLTTLSEASSLADVDISIEQISSMTEAASLAERNTSPPDSERTTDDKLASQAEASLITAEPSMEDELGEQSMEDELGEPSMEDELGEPSMEDELESESGQEQPPNDTTLQNRFELKNQAESLHGSELMAGPAALLTVEDELLAETAPSNLEAPSIEPFSEADLLAEPEVSIEDQLLIETEPLYEIEAMDELEAPVDRLSITPVDPPLAYSHELNEDKPSSGFDSTGTDNLGNKSIKTPIEHQPILPHNNQLTSKKPLSQNSIRPPTNSSKISRIASTGQPSKGKSVSSTLSSSNIPSLRPNPLSIRSNLPHGNSSNVIPPRTKIPNSIHQPSASITSKSSLAKSLSSVSSSTSSVRPSDKTAKSSKIITNAPVIPVQLSRTTKSSHSSTLTPTKSIPKLRATTSKSSLITPSKLTSSTTPSKPRSINSSTPSLSRASSSLNKSQPAANRGTATGSNLDVTHEPSPKTSAKSSQAFREMLAKAKRSRPKPPTAPNSPDRNSVPALPSVAGQTEALDPWGFQPIEKAVEKAQKTGKLNVASRMLSKVPAEVYDKLLSHTSIFHPSNRPSNTSDPKQSEKVDLKFSFDDEERVTSGVAWYETVDLIHLNMSLNELIELDDEFGGFEALTNCDLHCNQLTGLPSTFGLLTNLTLLDLSSNQLGQFPVPILSLVNLKELNLSKNQLTRLWPLDWQPTLKKQLANAVKPPPIRNEFLGGDQSFNSMDESFNSTDQPSIITESSFEREKFCDQFPSSPSKSYPNKSDRSLMHEEGAATARADVQPFPNLQKLRLSGNKFNTSSLFGPDSVQLPRNVMELDLSRNLLGDCIDVSSHLRNLQKLTKLNLCGCGLSDRIFWFDLEGDYDQLDNEKNGLFEHLAELDLSHNAIDSLEPLESFFDRHCPRLPRLDYEGLPRELVKVVIHHGQGPGEVKVMIGNNFLRDEARRRRKVKMMTAQSSPKLVEPADSAPGAVVGIEKPLPEDEESKSSPEEIKDARTGKSSSSSSKRIDIAPKPIETMLLKHHSPKTSSLNMSSLQLTELSEDSMDYNGSALKIDVELVNLSHNQLSSFPRGIMAQFGATLTVLNLSRNRLSNSSSDTFDSHVCSLMGIKLPELVELNLASNFLSGSPRPIIRLIIEGFEAFKLKTLDLSLNQFESLDGLYELFKLHQIPGHPSGDASTPHFRLEKLLLDGNRISQIDDLIQISTEILDSISGPSKEKPGAIAAEDIKDHVQFNFLEEIGLSDNSIGQLPPCLGFLPTKRLAVARNLFRFPLRKVYDCVGGDVNILSWLRDRS